MISENSKAVRKLLAMREELQQHAQVDLQFLVARRLNRTFDLYVRKLEVSYNRLLQKDELRVLNQLSKEE